MNKLFVLMQLNKHKNIILYKNKVFKYSTFLFIIRYQKINYNNKKNNCFKSQEVYAKLIKIK